MSLLKSAATVGSYTLASRVLGFIRDQLIAFTLGTGPVMEAFAVAQRLPNMFRALFAEGAFNAAFVPFFAKRVEGDGAEAAHRFAIEVFSALLTWLLLFTALAMIAMPWLMLIIAPGFGDDPQTFDLAVELTRICFPYLLFMSLTALQSGVLNSLNRFTAAAAAPILLNLAMIGANIVAWAFDTGNTPLTGRIFAWGVTLSGVAQYTLLAVACRRAGMPLFPRLPRLTPDVKQVFRTSVPGLVSGGVMQINLVVATMIATTIDRAVSYLYYADRVYQLPLGVIGVAIGVVLLPDISRRLRAGDLQGVRDSQNRALEFSLFLTLPSAIALMAIPGPIIHAVFEHGAFARSDTLAVAPALLAFAAGLPAFAMTKVFQPGFYAREDTRTPMRFAMISVAVNVAGSLLLSRYFGHVGIAMATSLAAWVNTALLGVTLARQGYYAPDQRLAQRLPRILFASLAMGAILLFASWQMRTILEGPEGLWVRALALLGLVILGIVSYFLIAHVTGAMRLGEIMGVVRRRPPPASAA
ncbi:murein biosynthesis integral membrane protein MurJ [soil metagenome]